MGRLYYCRCGRELWVEWWWNGLDHYPVFFDAKAEYPPGITVDHCPKCGEALDRFAFERKSILTEPEYLEYAASV